ncbi:MAG: DUF167 domain-containing protein [Vicinamibacterales bacterium]
MRVIPRAGRSGAAGKRDDAFLIRLTAPPVGGAGNAELVEVLSGLLKVPRRNITIVGGERSRRKRVRVAGVTREEAGRLLTAQEPSRDG